MAACNNYVIITEIWESSIVCFQIIVPKYYNYNIDVVPKIWLPLIAVE